MPSGDCQNASFTIQRKNLPHEARGLSANTFSSALVPCRIIGTRALFPTPKLQEKSSIDTPTSTDYCKRTIGDKAFARGFSLMFDNHTERTYRMVVQKIPSNLSNARYLFADYSVSFRYKSSTFALLTQENLSRERNPPTSREKTKEETPLNYGT